MNQFMQNRRQTLGFESIRGKENMKAAGVESVRTLFVEACG